MKPDERLYIEDGQEKDLRNYIEIQENGLAD